MIKIWLVSYFLTSTKEVHGPLFVEAVISPLLPLNFPDLGATFSLSVMTTLGDSLHCPLQPFTLTCDQQGMHSQPLTPPYLHLCTTICPSLNICLFQLSFISTVLICPFILTLILSAMCIKTNFDTGTEHEDILMYSGSL